jgi:hypothetical protein
MMKLKVHHIVTIALLLLILYFVSGRGVSRMGAELNTSQGPMAAAGPANIFDLKHQLKCVAGGFNPDSSYSPEPDPRWLLR